MYGYFNSIFTHSFWWVFTEYSFGKNHWWVFGEQFTLCFLRFCKNLFSFHQNRGCIVSLEILPSFWSFLQAWKRAYSFYTLHSERFRASNRWENSSAVILVNLRAEISCSNNHRENSMSFYLLKSESIKLPLAVKTLSNFAVWSKFNWPIKG